VENVAIIGVGTPNRPARGDWLHGLRYRGCLLIHIYLKIIIPSAPPFPKWPHSIRSFEKNVLIISHILRGCLIPSLSHTP
jgi:hypothetical protein